MKNVKKLINSEISLDESNKMWRAISADYEE